MMPTWKSDPVPFWSLVEATIRSSVTRQRRKKEKRILTNPTDVLAEIVRDGVENTWWSCKNLLILSLIWAKEKFRLSSVFELRDSDHRRRPARWGRDGVTRCNYKYGGGERKAVWFYVSVWCKALVTPTRNESFFSRSPGWNWRLASELQGSSPFLQFAFRTNFWMHFSHG